MHLVVARILGSDGRESPCADMQRDLMQRDAARREAGDQRRRKMQPRRRRRDRPRLGGEHRLVVRAVAWRQSAPRGDVRGQGRRAQALDRLVQRRACELKAQQNLAGFALVLHFRVERCEKAGHAFARLAETDALADLEPLGGPRERPPAAIVDALDQGRFDRGDRLASDPDALEPRRDDPRIVDDQRVAGVRKSGRSRTCASVRVAVGADNQHPRAVPRIRRSQRDALRRKNEIEGVDAHRGHRRPVEAVNLWREERGLRLGPCTYRRPCPAPHEPPASLGSQLNVALTILSGSRTGSPRLILSTFSMPDTTLPQTVYWRLRKGASQSR